MKLRPVLLVATLPLFAVSIAAEKETAPPPPPVALESVLAEKGTAQESVLASNKSELETQHHEQDDVDECN